ncbi:uncharacterized protein LOC143293634 [Babylonia areolata]|uniref:uncharacterized protein LOC143293634 n=1 Tax=Babylonia areolata TaxID=304850 RepID=UPI003FD1B534
MASRPKVKEGIGEKPQFKELKLETVSHKASEFETNTNIFDIELKTPGNVKSIHTMHSYDGALNETQLENTVFIQLEDKKAMYRVAVRETGWHKLNIFIAPISSEGMSLPCVFTYLFYVTKVTKEALPFPKQYADWKAGCYLYSPMFLDPSGDLEKVEFKVKVPDAKKVAVTCGDEWYHLQENDGKWEVEACLTHHNRRGEQVKVNANFPGNEASQFACLLVYTL